MNEYMKKLGRRGYLLGGAAVVVGAWRFGNSNIVSIDTITAIPQPLAATVNVAFNNSVCTFTCSNATLGPAAFSADINWGDGSAHTAGSVAGIAGSTMIVGGLHTYTTAASYTVTVVITKTSQPAVTATAGSTMTVSGAGADTITALSTPLAANTGVSYTGIAGSFTCNDALLPASAFTGTLNWGDGGGVVTGTVAGSAGSFTVGAPPAHTYSAAGAKTVTATLTITATPAVTATASNTLTVSDPATPGTLRATITLNAIDGGGTYIFDESTGTNLGTYSDLYGRFTESNFRVWQTLNTSGTFPLAGTQPYKVDFRRLSTGNHVSVVFGLGQMRAYGGPLEPYTVVISGTELTGGPVTINVPRHVPFQRWRWRSTPWPFPLKLLADFVAAGTLPNMNASLANPLSGVNGDPFPGANNNGNPYTILGIANLTASFGQTGGRGDIGIVTEAQGQWLTNPTTAAATQMFDEAEVGGTFNWDVVDLATNNVLDAYLTWPTSSMNHDNPGGADPWVPLPYQAGYGFWTFTGPPGTVVSWDNMGGRYLSDANGTQFNTSTVTIGAGGTINTVFGQSTLGGTAGLERPKAPFNLGALNSTVTATLEQGILGSPITLDTAHMAAIGYVPYLATGDSYYLETIQRQVMFILSENNSAPVRGWGVLQPRATGWSARTIAEAAKVSPASGPTWIHPSSLFIGMLNTWSTFLLPETVNATGYSPIRNLFHQISGGAGFSGGATAGGSWAGCALNAPDGLDTWYEPYQEYICLSGFAMVHFLHPTNTAWTSLVNWIAQYSIGMTSDTSGWGSANPVVYCIKVCDTIGSPFYTSWTQLWHVAQPLFLNPTAGCGLLQQQNIGVFDPPPTNIPDGSFPVGAFDYTGWLGMAMNIAWQAGLTSGVSNVTPGATKMWRAVRTSNPGYNYDGHNTVPMPVKYCFTGPYS